MRKISITAALLTACMMTACGASESDNMPVVGADWRTTDGFIPLTLKLPDESIQLLAGTGADSFRFYYDKDTQELFCKVDFEKPVNDLEYAVQEVFAQDYDADGYDDIIIPDTDGNLVIKHILRYDPDSKVLVQIADERPDNKAETEVQTEAETAVAPQDDPEEGRGDIIPEEEAVEPENDPDEGRGDVIEPLYFFQGNWQSDIYPSGYTFYEDDTFDAVAIDGVVYTGRFVYDDSAKTITLYNEMSEEIAVLTYDGTALVNEDAEERLTYVDEFSLELPVFERFIDEKAVPVSDIAGLYSGINYKECSVSIYSDIESMGRGTEVGNIEITDDKGNTVYSDTLYYAYDNCYMFGAPDTEISVYTDNEKICLDLFVDGVHADYFIMSEHYES